MRAFFLKFFWDYWLFRFGHEFEIIQGCVEIWDTRGRGDVYFLGFVVIECEIGARSFRVWIC